MESKMPVLRFPEFTDEWKLKKIEEIAFVTSGGTPSRTNNNYWNGDIPWITTSLIDFNVIKTAEEYITEEGLNNSSTKLFPEGTILMAMYGQGKTRGKVGVLGIDAATNQACAALKIKKGLSISFVFNYLAKDYEKIRSIANDGGQQNLSAGLIKSLKILLPTLPEQTKIANFITAIDKRINLLQKKKTELERYKAGVMQKIFNQEIRFKDNNGNDFPDWEEKTLGEIGSFQTSSVDKLSKDDEEQVYLVNYMNVYRHENINNANRDKLQVVTAKENQIKSSGLKKGDILFTPSSETPDDIGHSVVIFEDLVNTLFSYHLMRFRPKISLDLLYSHYFCNIPSVLKQLSNFATGSTRFTISVGNFSKVIVNLPSFEEQQKIANFLNAIDKSIEKLITQIDETIKFKQGLLQKMFV